MTIEQALETEAEAQAICMQTKDYERAYNAFVKRETEVRGQLTARPAPLLRDDQRRESVRGSASSLALGPRCTMRPRLRRSRCR